MYLPRYNVVLESVVVGSEGPRRYPHAYQPQSRNLIKASMTKSLSLTQMTDEMLMSLNPLLPRWNRNTYIWAADISHFNWSMHVSFVHDSNRYCPIKPMTAMSEMSLALGLKANDWVWNGSPNWKLEVCPGDGFTGMFINRTIAQCRAGLLAKLFFGLV